MLLPPTHLRVFLAHGRELLLLLGSVVAGQPPLTEPVEAVERPEPAPDSAVLVAAMPAHRREAGHVRTPPVPHLRVSQRVITTASSN